MSAVPVDLYCERLGPELLAEPVNVATNATFFLVAWELWRFARRRNALSGDIRLLIALIFAIGIGSSLFHSFATTWTHWLDLVPILMFQLAFLWAYMRRPIGLRPAPTAALVAAFLAVALYGRQFPHLLNGSLTYAPALFVMLALGLYHWRRQKPRRLALLAATGVLAAALVFRTIDAAICERFPYGTHFLWHLLIPVALYLCVLALLASPTAPDAR